MHGRAVFTLSSRDGMGWLQIYLRAVFIGLFGTERAILIGLLGTERAILIGL